MIAECHYKNGLIKYHEMPAPMPFRGDNGMPIFKVPEQIPPIYMSEQGASEQPPDIIHTFQFSHNKEFGGQQIPVFNEI